MTKIVYNDCYASFGLPREAILRYAEIKGITLIYKDQVGGTPWDEDNGKYFNVDDIDRADPALVQVVEEFGLEYLQMAELPAGTLYRIDEYDGLETVMAQDNYEWKVA